MAWYWLIVYIIFLISCGVLAYIYKRERHKTMEALYKLEQETKKLKESLEELRELRRKI